MAEFEAALEDIFSEISAPLTNFAFHILKNTYDAQDMVAETFVKILEYTYVYDQFPARSFYFTVIRNLSIDFLRKKKRISYIDGNEFMPEPQDKSDTFEEVHEIFTGELIDKLIKQLPERYANVFYLRCQCDMSFSEIGDILEIEEGNARILFHRARKKMKELYELEFKEDNYNES